MLGIIILNYNTSDDVIESVKSINSSTHIPYSIYIVDNNSTDDSYEKLSLCFRDEKGIKVIPSDYNGGYSYGNNVGIKCAVEDGCDYLLISNPDVIYYDKSIDIMMESIQKSKRIGAIGPSTPSLDQDESQLLRKVYTPKVYFFSKKPFLYLSKVFKSLRTEYNYPKKPSRRPYLFKGMVRGCSFIISSELFKQIGFFDDNVFLYSEEWIIAKKITDKGYYCAFQSNAKALHKEATSTKQVGTGFQSFHLYLSSFYYLKKYSGCSGLYLLFAFLQNIISYSMKAVMNSSYRKLYRKFIASQFQLFLGKKEKIRYDHVE